MRLFDPFEQRGVRLRNRIVVSPMCMYSCDGLDGMANAWHMVHLGARAVGGAGLVFTEATAVEARGRISPQDLGIWSDAHVAPLQPITAFIKQAGAVPGMQLAHAGRKAGTYRPWESRRGRVPEAEGGWTPVGPSPLPFNPADPAPAELSVADIQEIVGAFAAAARRALAAGFEVVEVHAAHGYLIHQFLSPLSNHRTDAYGGAFANRTRLLREVVDAVRREWPERLPLWVRISATDWAEAGGWDLDQSVEASRMLREHGVDVVDCSSGGILAQANIPMGPGYQVPFAERVRREAGIATAAVGLITDPGQAEAIVAEGRADLVLLGRQFLRDPYWGIHAAAALGVDYPWPVQYLRAKP
jgi:2,4-dienoyl-CoA reductase-like NADH-dependent reductase (Old Yellow Enzyme family)